MEITRRSLFGFLGALVAVVGCGGGRKISARQALQRKYGALVFLSRSVTVNGVMKRNQQFLIGVNGEVHAPEQDGMFWEILVDHGAGWEPIDQGAELFALFSGDKINVQAARVDRNDARRT